MLINPYQVRLPTYPGTRLLQETFGLTGYQVLDDKDPERTWVLQALYEPLPERMVGGIRAKLYDQKGFVTFCNQRDLEVLLGIASPGTRCRWLGKDYAAPGDRNWFGLCTDSDDLVDDLFERELWLRQTQPLLPSNLELTRRVHMDEGYDVEELDLLLWDADPDTGYGPDPRFETIERRWRRVSRDRVVWRHL